MCTGRPAVAVNSGTKPRAFSRLSSMILRIRRKFILFVHYTFHRFADELSESSASEIGDRCGSKGRRAQKARFVQGTARGRLSVERTLAGKLLKRGEARARFRRGVDATGPSYSRTAKLDASGWCAAES